LFILFGLLAKRWAFLNERKQLIAEGVRWVYGAVEEMARRSPSQLDDKAALALKKLADLLSVAGQTPLSPAETMKAKLAFDTFHQADKKLESATSPS
jgi:16S rRNA G527 N7-methylase RsmG